MNIRVKQRDITDCGAACLASVAAHYRLQLPVSKIRQWAGTDKKGTSAWGLIKAAEKMGMTAKGVRVSPDKLSEIPLPAIAHIIVNERLHHYVVIYRVSPSSVEIMDPGTGLMEKKKHEEFFKEWQGIMILLSPSERFIQKDEKISNIRRFAYLLYPHKYLLIQALVGAMVFTLLGLSTSIYIQKITDHVLLNGNRNLLNLMSVLMVILLLFQIFIGIIQSVLVLKTGQLIDARLILGYYRHLLRLPQQFFDSMRAGEIISRINDAVKIRAFINDTMISLVVNLFILLFAFLLMFIYSWRLALIMLLMIPLYSLVYVIYNSLNKRQERKLMEQAAELESQLIESVRSVKTIKQLSIEHHIATAAETRFVRLLYSTYKSGLNSVFSMNSSIFISRIFTIILLWTGSMFVLRQEITPGELMSFYALLGYFTGPVSGLIGMNKVWQNASIAADRLFEIMDLEREEEDNQTHIEVIRNGFIEFARVSFSYGTRNDLFTDFSLKIRLGEVTAIIGDSGSGKTTIAALLQKMYPVRGGAIYLCGTNIMHISRDSLGRIIGIVPQNLDLFSGSITDNVAVGETNPDISRILSILEQLGMLGFVERLPGGLNTWIGEQGAILSGGQKQKLAIARALYRDPQILILDEATSSLDSDSEYFIQQTIDRFRNEGKTVMVIAHRLSTIVKADNIVVLKAGMVTEQGSHSQLWNHKGIYYSMWQRQLPFHEC